MIQKKLESCIYYMNLYRSIIPLYNKLQKEIVKILNFLMNENFDEEEYIIEGRVKSLHSFAEKYLRKDYNNPLIEMMDLAGIRIVLRNLEVKEKFTGIINKYFRIDRDYSKEKIEELKVQEFGYISTHYIVRLLSKKFYLIKTKMSFPRWLSKLKAEIQVRTFLEHSWAINQRGLIYKGDFELPKQYGREINRVAALLEMADRRINSVVKKMHDYETSYGAYMTEDEIKREIEMLETIFHVNNENIDLGYKIAKLAMEIEEWEKSIEILENLISFTTKIHLQKDKRAMILKDLGISKVQFYKPLINRNKFEEGQKNIEDSIKINKNDSDAYAALAGSYKKLQMHKKAHYFYKEALKVNPNDPYPIVNYLIYELSNSDNVSTIIDYHRSMMLNAIKKRSKHINVLVDIPWANFDFGALIFLLGHLNVSLHNYLLAIILSQHPWMISTTLNTINMLRSQEKQLKGLNLIRILLLMGLYCHPTNRQKNDPQLNQEIIQKLSDNLGLSINHANLKPPIVIIAGGTDEQVQQQIHKYKANLLEAFRDIHCTIISGGTTAGISGIAGDISENYGESISLIGYTPRNFPNINIIGLDPRYEHRFTDAEDFSILEAFQYWYDIIRSGCEPSQVKLIGINGGKISALEFRLAIALGAQVGIIEDSGRSANEIINDPWWSKRVEKLKRDRPIKMFKILKNSSEDIKNFLTRPFITDPDIENLQKLLINHKHGQLVYEFDFTQIPIDGDLVGGLLTAIQMFAKEVNIGQIPEMTTEKTTITMNTFQNGDYRVFFILNEKPVPSLKRKISDSSRAIDMEFHEEFNNLQQIIAFTDHGMMGDVLAGYFGPEILKFFENV